MALRDPEIHLRVIHRLRKSTGSAARSIDSCAINTLLRNQLIHRWRSAINGLRELIDRARHIHGENSNAGWEKSIEELCITFYKVSITEGTPKVLHSLNILAEGFTWSLTTCGHKITSLCQVTRNLPSTIKSGKLFVTCNIAECVDLYYFVAADAVAVMKAADSSKVCVGNYDDQFSTLIQIFADHQIEGRKLCLHLYIDWWHLIKNQFYNLL